MINAIIIDDLPEAQQILRQLLAEHCPEVNIVGQAYDYDDGKSLIRMANADLLFLDIELKEKNGFDLLLDSDIGNTHVIFTTGYVDYSIKAFQFNAVHYLVKPLDPNDLKDAVSRVIKLQQSNISETGNLRSALREYKDRHSRKLQITSDKGTLFINMETIEYLKADGSYTEITLEDGSKHLASKLLKDFEQALPNELFYRLSKTHIINLQFVKFMSKKEGGTVEMLNGYTIQVPRRKKKEFLQKMTGFGL